MHQFPARAGFLAAALLLALSASAQAATTGLDAAIDRYFTPVSDAITTTVFYAVPVLGAALPIIVVWLIVAAIVFTIYFRFINFRGFGHALRLVRGDYDDPNDPGEVSHFQALTAALSGTVGLGNIAGVAIAISVGGPGATFWMILAGLLGMATKFTECTLGVKYRREHADGTVSGGPMYYLQRGFAEKGRGGLGRGLAVAFAIFTVFGSLGGGNMFQANQAYQQMLNATGGADSALAGYGWAFGLILAVLVGVVIIGGIKSIAAVTSRLVPLMAGIYLLAAIFILLANAASIPAAFAAIFVGAFAPEGIAGGFVGVLIQGFRRATFSNEAGIGSAAIAHAAVRTDKPVTEGFVALLEPFIDTVVICTMTALVIVITGAYALPGLGGVTLTSTAFASVISWFPWVLTIAVLLFAYSTIITWSYYGAKATGYLFGDSPKAELAFKLVFLVFTVIGTPASLAAIINFSDSMIFLMAIPNIIGLYYLAPVVKRELDVYWAALQRGEIRRYRGAGD